MSVLDDDDLASAYGLLEVRKRDPQAMFIMDMAVEVERYRSLSPAERIAVTNIIAQAAVDMQVKLDLLLGKRANLHVKVQKTPVSQTTLARIAEAAAMHMEHINVHES